MAEAAAGAGAEDAAMEALAAMGEAGKLHGLDASKNTGVIVLRPAPKDTLSEISEYCVIVISVLLLPLVVAAVWAMIRGSK